MLTPAELLWAAIGASFCGMAVSGLLALVCSSRTRIETGGHSPPPCRLAGLKRTLRRGANLVRK
jgi:hypothetical protein